MSFARTRFPDGSSVELEMDEPNATNIPDYSKENAVYEDGGGSLSRPRK